MTTAAPCAARPLGDETPPDRVESTAELTYNAVDEDAAFQAALAGLIDAVIVPAIVAHVTAETQGEWT